MSGQKITTEIEAMRERMREEAMMMVAGIAKATADQLREMQLRIVQLERDVIQLKAHATLKNNMEVDGLRDQVVLTNRGPVIDRLTALEREVDDLRRDLTGDGR